MYRRQTPAHKTEATRAGSHKLPALFVSSCDKHFRRCVLYAVLYTLALWFAGCI